MRNLTQTFRFGSVTTASEAKNSTVWGTALARETDNAATDDLVLRSREKQRPYWLTTFRASKTTRLYRPTRCSRMNPRSLVGRIEGLDD